MNTQHTDAIDMVVDYQRAQNLAATTIRNRRSILTSLARHTGTLVDCDIFSLRRYIGREGVTAGTRRTEPGAIVAFFTFLKEEGIREDNPATKLPIVAYSRTRAILSLPVNAAPLQTRGTGYSFCT